MKTTEPGIEKIEGKRGTVYRVQIRKKGCKHQSRTFNNFREARKWKYDTFNALDTGGITDTAKMRRTTRSHLIERYFENVLESSSSNYKTHLGQLQWWRYRDNRKFSWNFEPLEILKEEAIYLQPGLPMNKPLKALRLDGVGAVANGGTIVSSTAEVGKVNVLSVDCDDKETKIRYSVVD